MHQFDQARMVFIVLTNISSINAFPSVAVLPSPPESLEVFAEKRVDQLMKEDVAYYVLSA